MSQVQFKVQFKDTGIGILIALVVAGAAVSLSAPPAAIARQSAASGQQTTRDDDKNTVGEISEEVAQVRLQKLGYSNIQQLTHNGDYWEATATKDSKTRQIRLHVRAGAREEKPVSAASK